MSNDREIMSGGNSKDETAGDEEVKLHGKSGGFNMDDSSTAEDDDNDVEAHGKSGGFNMDSSTAQDDDDNDVEAHILSGGSN
jgi:hypothetical protein